MAPPKKKHILTQADFDRLLAWLGDDSEQAAARYEQIRRRLIVIFAGRDCSAPEDLADETIDRVARKIPEVEASYEGDRARYFYGVANFIYQEYLRRKTVSVETPPVDEKDERGDSRYECLEKCLAALPADSRKLIVGYYAENKQAKIDYRKQLAVEFDLSGNALRHRIRRLRIELKICIEKCVQRKSDTN